MRTHARAPRCYERDPRRWPSPSLRGRCTAVKPKLASASHAVKKTCSVLRDDDAQFSRALHAALSYAYLCTDTIHIHAIDHKNYGRQKFFDAQKYFVQRRMVPHKHPPQGGVRTEMRFPAQGVESPFIDLPELERKCPPKYDRDERKKIAGVEAKFVA